MASPTILSAIIKPSIRAGFGIFYNPIRARSYASGYYFNPPYALAFVPMPQFPNPFPGALPPPAQLVGVDYNTDVTPEMYQWNFNIQRQLLESTTLTVGYVGSRGLHLYGARDINPVLPTLVNGVQVFGVPRGATAGHHQQPPSQSGGRGAEQRGSRGRFQLPLLAGGAEPALLARPAIPAFLHVVEVHG